MDQDDYPNSNHPRFVEDQPSDFWTAAIVVVAALACLVVFFWIGAR
jgi:hypothetical protein